jgi:uncharacterized protein YjbI with pentapeptide repeats
MAKPEHLEQLKRGVEYWNIWRKEHPNIEPDLTGVDFHGADLHGADLHGADLSDADLSEANLSEANLSEASLRGVRLKRAIFIRGILEGANFSRSDSLRMPTIGEAILSKPYPSALADLSEVNLSEANLIGANLENVILNKANLHKAKLALANLTYANLDGAVLTNADLTETMLTHATLIGTNLNGANLEGAILIAAKLSRATLKGTKLGGADFREADLRGTSLDPTDLTAVIINQTTLLPANLAITTASRRSSFPISGAVERLSKAKPGEVQEIAASQIELLNDYYQQVLEQAKNCFRWALIAAGIGLVFFLAATGFLLYRNLLSVAVITTISGVLFELIAGVNFYLYAQTTKQLAEFHDRLNTTQRFLLANSVCEALEGAPKLTARHELVQFIAGHYKSQSGLSKARKRTETASDSKSRPTKASKPVEGESK